MEQLLATISSFPTALWTVLLGVALVYWVACAIGVLDDGIDLSGHTMPDGTGDDLGDLAGKLVAMGLGGVPFSLVVTLLALYGWLVSALISQYLLWLPGLLHYLVGAGVLLVSIALALPATAYTLRPLRRLFVTHNAVEKHALVGQLCQITTQNVDARFGRAEVASRGMPFNIRVSLDAPNQLKRGSQALITDYDATRDVYTIAELEGDLPSSAQ